MTHWQPIDTAPKDGSDILVADKDGDMAVVYWHAGGHFELTFQGLYAAEGEFENPTHWMPLPDPPRGTQ